MFKRYTGEEIHGFMFSDYNAKEPRWIDYKDYEKECRAINEREHATIVGLGRRIAKLEAALRTANADLKAVWIETGKGLDGLKRTEVALGLTSETAAEQGCEHCGSIEVNPNCPACQGIERYDHF